jgi:hypothetical protein
MNQIVKTKFLCKNGSRTGPVYGGVWIDRFIEGKWYDGEYETWSWEDGYRVNNGWRKYWVINEQGVGEEISRAHFRVIFETDTQQLRDRKIEDIIK